MLSIISLVISAISTTLSLFCQPKPPKPKPKAFNSETFPLSNEGEEQIVIFGQVWQKDWLVIATGNFRTQAIKKKGGKK